MCPVQNAGRTNESAVSGVCAYVFVCAIVIATEKDSWNPQLVFTFRTVVVTLKTGFSIISRNTARLLVFYAINIAIVIQCICKIISLAILVLMTRDIAFHHMRTHELD